MAADRFIQRSITDEIMYALMELSGNEYVDIYAAKAKEDQEKAVPAAPSRPGRGLPRTKAS
jgi:1-acyl-sn-glycerol-3-phosphate acyltransferase